MGCGGVGKPSLGVSHLGVLESSSSGRSAARLGGLSCTEIGTRMVTRDSDLTRLMSGLERAGFVVRGTDADDRRRSTNRITAAGKALLNRLDRDVADAANQTLGHLGRTRLTALRDLLVAFAPPPPPSELP